MIANLIEINFLIICMCLTAFEQQGLKYYILKFREKQHGTQKITTVTLRTQQSLLYVLYKRASDLIIIYLIVALTTVLKIFFDLSHQNYVTIFYNR